MYSIIYNIYCIYIYKTVRVAQESLRAPTIGGGSARPRGGGGGSQRTQISFQSHPEYTKMQQKWRLPALIDFKNVEKAIYYLKVLNKIYSQNFL